MNPRHSNKPDISEKTHEALQQERDVNICYWTGGKEGKTLTIITSRAIPMLVYHPHHVRNLDSVASRNVSQSRE